MVKVIYTMVHSYFQWKELNCFDRDLIEVCVYSEFINGWMFGLFDLKNSYFPDATRICDLFINLLSPFAFLKSIISHPILLVTYLV